MIPVKLFLCTETQLKPNVKQKQPPYTPITKKEVLIKKSNK